MPLTSTIPTIRHRRLLPKGFNGVLTRKQWKGVVDFSRAIDAKIISSFAGSDGVRDSNGAWTPVEAQKILSYTQSLKGEIAAVEMFNEPNQGVGTTQATPYDAAAYRASTPATDDGCCSFC